jgi:hypothetical protein
MAQQPTYKNRKRAAHEGGQQPVIGSMLNNWSFACCLKAFLDVKLRNLNWE